MAKNLQEILALLPRAKVRGETNREIRSITTDSRQVEAGSLFVCIEGAHVDGHSFIPQAAAQGAAAVLVTREVAVPGNVTAIRVSDIHAALEKIAPWFYDYPTRSMRVIGVTGTNGKTTTTNIVKQIFTAAGHKVGLIGTINIQIGDRVEASHNTTPDVVELQRIFHSMLEAGCDYVVMEVSSHALALRRVAGIEFDVAALTNITQDHLDFHGSMDNYREAKALLFSGLREESKGNKHAILNMDDFSSPLIKDKVTVPLLTYGKGPGNDISCSGWDVGAKGMRLTLNTPVGVLLLNLHLTGEFNVYNVMTAVSIALAENIGKATIVAALEDFAGVEGRFQLVEAGQPFTVVVDYAHTPDGLDNVLRTARLLTKGRLWAVFGCGGDRDAKKRPLMGRIALELADCLVITSDNPRSEDPESILDDIERGLGGNHPDKEIVRIANRREGIEYALAHAAADDVVVIAGKGHEHYQILKDRTIHFDDTEVVREYWKGREQ